MTLFVVKIASKLLIRHAKNVQTSTTTCYLVSFGETVADVVL